MRHGAELGYQLHEPRHTLCMHLYSMDPDACSAGAGPSKSELLLRPAWLWTHAYTAIQRADTCA